MEKMRDNEAGGIAKRKCAVVADLAVDPAFGILEGGMDAVNLEGGSPPRIAAAKAIVEAGIAVMGHVGLTPQAISVLGGQWIVYPKKAQFYGSSGVNTSFSPSLHNNLALKQLEGIRFDLKMVSSCLSRLGQVGEIINKALLDCMEEVTNGSFPVDAAKKKADSELPNQGNPGSKKRWLKSIFHIHSVLCLTQHDTHFDFCTDKKRTKFLDKDATPFQDPLNLLVQDE
ncbi:Ketopantoate hydroxymethyltransferase [Dillenia turbinata]|uniref:3-methyl-2-oxobutanoate hydroxymethyltransferase n=1 Tax=Dillenia turbinata TaxID=194707 RepID=A0AAN8YYY7_9MAGN